jgi:hypothetical protein
MSCLVLRPLTVVTGALVRPFAYLDRRFPSVRRHGYLLASVAVKAGNFMKSLSPRVPF